MQCSLAVKQKGRHGEHAVVILATSCVMNDVAWRRGNLRILELCIDAVKATAFAPCGNEVAMQRQHFDIKIVFPVIYGFPCSIINIRRSWQQLIFMMDIHIYIYMYKRSSLYCDDSLYFSTWDKGSNQWYFRLFIMSRFWTKFRRHFSIWRCIMYTETWTFTLTIVSNVEACPPPYCFWYIAFQWNPDPGSAKSHSDRIVCKYPFPFVNHTYSIYSPTRDMHIKELQ